MKKPTFGLRAVVRFGTTFIGGVIVALLFTFFAFRPSEDAPTESLIIRSGEAGTIHELIDIETAEARNRPFSELRKSLNNILNTFAEDVPAASIYYEDLDSGKWMVINPDTQYQAVSMVKVPILLFAYRIADQHPDIWATPIRYAADRPDIIRNNNHDPSRSIIPGEPYLLSDILHRMIAYSDNTAKDAVMAFLSDTHREELLAVISDLEKITQYPLSSPDDSEHLLIRPYARLFRMLYNASYLSQQSSADALDILKQSDFPHGIRGATAPEIAVASKFGLYKRDPEKSGDLDQLHDCSVVYHPKGPYTLCVFTKAESHAVAKVFIQEIAGLVYASVTEHAKQ